MPENLILSALSKTYQRRGKPDVPAVCGIDLTVDEGELLGLLGPSGCGKSSSLRMIAGLESPTSGDIRIGGRSIVHLPPHARNVAVAFENYALYPPLTVEENIAFGMRARNERDVKRRAHEVAERLGISDILTRKPGALSSGQKQRVSLARAIVRTPSVLLLDEPLSHLDAAERDKTRRELKRLQRETGYTTVLVTHDQHEALSLADRIAVMDAGVFKQVGTPDEVYDAPQNVFVADFVGEPRMNLIDGQLTRDNGTSTVQLANTVRLPFRPLETVRSGRVVLGIRPQDIRIVDPSQPHAIPATVFAFEPLQEVSRVTVTLPNVESRLVIELHHDVSFKRDERIGLILEAARTHLFNSETGDRIECQPLPSHERAPGQSGSS